MKSLIAALALLLLGAIACAFCAGAEDSQPPRPVAWKHLSSRTGELPPPNGGHQQTACIVFDIDNDKAAEIVIAERTAAPAVIWLDHTATGWRKHVIDPSHQRPEAGGTAFDVDGDGDLDLILGGDGGSNELWWYENPAPNLQADQWQRHYIKRSGGKAHHDQVVGDFLGSGRPQLAFWNQGAQKLFLAEIPRRPQPEPWPFTAIFDSSQVQSPIKQEGIFAADVDADGTTDLLGGQFWFKHLGQGQFQPVQLSPRPGRIVAGQFQPGRYPQIVVAPGDGDGPLVLYECRGNPSRSADWIGRQLLAREVIHGHTLEVADINADGRLDLFCAEMHTPGHGENCAAWVFYGDGRGNFLVQQISVGIGNHESRVADVDGDGRLDLVTKPYTWDTPRVDVWLNQGPAE